MSAVAGILGLVTDLYSLQNMQATMRRRGGKNHSHHHTEDVDLLYTGNENCLSLSWAGELYTIVCDGELYNAAEIRTALIRSGHTLEGKTHAELLLHAYAQWKEQMLDKLNGIYAFAIWEEHGKRLFLARDRMGVKPLFYTQAGGGLVFASEMKTLFQHPQIEAELDVDGAASVLLLGPGRTPGSGVFRNIYELEPGCYGFAQGRRLRIHQYWKLQDQPHSDDWDTTVEKVQTLVLDSISRQMETPTPMGTFLSGGLDSSLISSVVAGKLADKGQKLQTFSVDYVGNDQYFRSGKFQPNSDPAYIRKMQEYLNSDHHWSVFSPEDLIIGIEEATLARDLPGMADVDISLLRFCTDVASQVPIALSGECADEIFGGYPWYRDPEIRDYDGFPWAQTTQERTEFLSPWILDKVEPEGFVKSRYLQTLRQADILPGTDPVNHRIKQLVNLNFRWFMQTLIDRNDRMSAGTGLSVRVPLCDYRIAEYLYSVPWEMKNHNGREKGLLREAMKDYLPEAVLYRKKSPFPKTHHPHYLALAEEKLKQLLQDPTAPIYQLVPRKALETLLYMDFPWPWYGQLMRRPQTIVYMLQINFWLKDYSVRIV